MCLKCTFDYFIKGRHKYTFENVYLEDKKIKLKDDTQKIILNTKGTLVKHINEKLIEVKTIEQIKEIARNLDSTH